MREYEIGSEAWMRERIERGLDPSEGDRPNDAPLVRLDFELIRPPGYAAVSVNLIESFSP